MFAFRAFDELTKAIASGVSRREVLSRAAGVVAGLLVIGGRTRVAFGGEKKDVLNVLEEIVFRSKKFCIYTDFFKGGETVLVTSCAVAIDAPCLDREATAKDQSVTIEKAKTLDEKDLTWRSSDGSLVCRSSEGKTSIHHEDGTFFCSTPMRCDGPSGGPPILRRASCVGMPDPDEEGKAICPGLSACMSAKLILPRPARAKSKKE